MEYDATGIHQVYDTARGLSLEGRAFWERQETVTRPYTRTMGEYVDRIAQPGLSTLRLIPDEEFESGLAALRRHSAATDTEGLVSETLDIFIFRR